MQFEIRFKSNSLLKVISGLSFLLITKAVFPVDHVVVALEIEI